MYSQNGIHGKRFGGCFFLRKKWETYIYIYVFTHIYIIYYNYIVIIDVYFRSIHLHITKLKLSQYSLELIPKPLQSKGLEETVKIIDFLFSNSFDICVTLLFGWVEKYDLIPNVFRHPQEKHQNHESPNGWRRRLSRGEWGLYNGVDGMNISDRHFFWVTQFISTPSLELKKQHITYHKT